MVAGLGFEHATLRTQGAKLTSEPPCPTCVVRLFSLIVQLIVASSKLWPAASSTCIQCLVFSKGA